MNLSKLNSNCNVIHFLIPFLLLSCKKQEAPLFITTSEVTLITDSTAQCGGSINYTGKLDISSRGVCWSLEHNPDLQDENTVDGAGNSAFTSILTNLKPGKKYYARAFAIKSGQVYFGNEVNFKTTGNWQLLSQSLSASQVYEIYFKNNLFYAATNSGVYFSQDFGITWSLRNKGLQSGVSVRSITSNNNYLLAGTNGAGVFVSNDNGLNWSQTIADLPNLNVQSLLSTNSTGLIYAGTLDGVYTTTNNGNSWKSTNGELFNKKITRLMQYGLGVYACTQGGLFFTQYDNYYWSPVDYPTYASLNVNSFFYNGSNFFVGTSGGVYMLNPGFQSSFNVFTDSCSALLSTVSTLYAASSNKVFVSGDNGLHWTELSIGLTSNVNYIYCLFWYGDYLYAGTDKGIYALLL